MKQENERRNRGKKEELRNLHWMEPFASLNILEYNSNTAKGFLKHSTIWFSSLMIKMAVAYIACMDIAIQDAVFN